MHVDLELPTCNLGVATVHKSIGGEADAHTERAVPPSDIGGERAIPLLTVATTSSGCEPSPDPSAYKMLWEL